MAKIELLFKTTTEAAYRQVRDEIARLTRFGAEPLVLFPSEEFEGGRFYHGRLGQRVSYSRQLPAGCDPLRAFALPFAESPFSAR